MLHEMANTESNFPIISTLKRKKKLFLIMFFFFVCFFHFVLNLTFPAEWHRSSPKYCLWFVPTVMVDQHTCESIKGMEAAQEWGWPLSLSQQAPDEGRVYVPRFSLSLPSFSTISKKRLLLWNAQVIFQPSRPFFRTLHYNYSVVHECNMIWDWNFSI